MANENTKAKTRWRILSFCENIEKTLTKTMTKTSVRNRGLQRDDSVTLAVQARRSARVDVRHYRPPVSLVYLEPTPLHFALHTLSEVGAGFHPGHEPLNSQVGKAREAVLLVGSTRIPIDTRLIYLGNHNAGIQFLELDNHWRSAIRHFFRVEFAAANLRPDFTRDGIDSEEEGIDSLNARHRLTFRGDSEHRAELILDPKLEPERFECHFPELGGDISWSKGKAIQIRWDLESTGPATALGTPRLRGQLVSLVQNLPGLGPGTRRALLAALAQARIE